jgi:hypothetical protein
VVIPLAVQHDILRRRNLLYAAITRGKRLVVLVARSRALAIAVQRVRDGVRFTLPGCPNALAWTVTAEPEGVLVHCTINRTEHDPDFIESIETFVEDWRTGLERSDVPAVESL